MEERLIECLKIAMEFHVTDIHFHLKTYPKESLSIEMKIEQDVRQMVPKEDDIRLFRYLMYKANLDLSDIHHPQTGRFEMEIDGQPVSLRFALVSSYHNTSGVLRILNQHSPLHIEDLTIDYDTSIWLRNITKHTSGLFIFSGPTGSGKTSLVQLIPRLYDATAGSVRVAGKDVRDYAFSDLRSQVAMVLQKNTLFSGTIRENLLWGNPHATEEEMIQVAKYAQAHNFIMEMPDGYDTKVEQGGRNFSGGQKQRLCIARAMLRKPAVLILDDSTSAVDTSTDSLIREAFFNHLPDTTVIIIAQRISSIQGADKIVVLEDGKMNGIGTHESLMETNELYREIYETQMEGAKVDAC